MFQFPPTQLFHSAFRESHCCWEPESTRPSILQSARKPPLDHPPSDKAKSPERFYQPNPKRYNHFDFADGSDPQDAPAPKAPGVSADKASAPKASKHNSQWSFEDFSTPHKPTQKARAHDVRHWGTENDEVLQETPARKPAAPKPRRDAETHFEFRDDGLPSSEPRAAARPRGATHNTGLGLYENNLYNEDGSAPTPESGSSRALGNITNLRDRSKIFDPHFEMADDLPPDERAAAAAAKPPAVSDDRRKVVKMMESNWDSYDDSSAAHKENNPMAGGGAGDGEHVSQGVQITGDSMGGKKGTGGRAWGIGDESDEEKAAPAVPGKKQGAAQKASNFWDF